MERSFRRAGLALALLLVVAGIALPNVSHAQNATPPATPAGAAGGGTSSPVPVNSIPVVGPIINAINNGHAPGVGDIINSGIDVVAPGTRQVTGAAAGAAAGATAVANGATADQAAAAATAAAAAASNPGAAVAHAGGSILAGLASDIIAAIATFILWLSTLLLGLVGTLFNWAVYVTIFQFGNLVGNSAGMLAAWGVLRDIGNIVLLFGFIFMGVGTILNLHDYNAKKALPALIIFAILLNFSLLAAEGIIDTSNVFASVMYNQSGVCDSSQTAAQCQNDKNLGIAGKVMQTAGISNVFHFDTIKNLVADPFQQALIFTGLAIFVTVTTVVLLAGAILLIARAVTLTFLVVLSPIGFAGMAIPPLHGIARTWWKTLISNAFFAPVYLLMILVSLKLMEGVQHALNVAGNANSTDLASVFQAGNASNISIAVTFALLIGFMIGALLVAKRMGAMGADFAISTATGVATFPAAMTGRTLVGGGAAGLGALQKKVAGRVAGRYANTKLAQWQPTTNRGKLGKFVADGIVKATGRGLDDTVNAPLDAGKAAKFGSLGSYDDLVKKREHRNHELEAGKTEAKVDDALGDPHEEGRNERIQELLQEISMRELIQTKYAKKITENIGLLARNMSAENFATFMKDKDVAEPVKEKMREERYKPITEKDGQIDKGDAGSIKKWANKDLEEFITSPGFSNLGPEKKKEFMSLMSDDQADFLKKSGNLTNSQQKMTQDYRKERFNLEDDAEGNPGFGTGLVEPVDRAHKGKGKVTRLERALFDMSGEKRANLEDETIAKIYTKLEPGDFRGIQRKDKMLPEERVDMGKHVDSMIKTNEVFKTYWNNQSDNVQRELKAFYKLTAETRGEIEKREREAEKAAAAAKAGSKP